MTRPRPAVVVLIVSALALAVAVAMMAWAGPGTAVSDVGQRPGGEPVGPSAAGSMPPSGSADGGAGPGATAGSRIDATRLPRPMRIAVPAVVEIPRLDVAASVERVGIDGAGQVEVPADIQRVGWYAFSSPAGAREGSTVLVGHRDGEGQGLGAFAAIGDLEPGDAIVVERADGERLRFEVVARESFAKSDIPLEELFTRTGPARLTLITCGGPFDPASLGYTDNIVVTAVPVGPPVDSAPGVRKTERSDPR